MRLKENTHPPSPAPSRKRRGFAGMTVQVGAALGFSIFAGQVRTPAPWSVTRTFRPAATSRVPCSEAPTRSCAPAARRARHRPRRSESIHPLPPESLCPCRAWSPPCTRSAARTFLLIWRIRKRSRSSIGCAVISRLQLFEQALRDRSPACHDFDSPSRQRLGVEALERLRRPPHLRQRQREPCREFELPISVLAVLQPRR